MVKALVFAALFVTAVHTAAVAQTTDRDIRSVISSQFSAFQADDFGMAFTFASPMIKSMFGTPERFGLMVREGYPMVWRPANVEFAGLEERGGRMVQTVMVTDQAGRLHLLDYEMIETADGWQINGVRLRRPSGAGA
ncbi:MAG: DUF4864 domain-containing protein [Pseudomonadota bacterium]